MNWYNAITSNRPLRPIAGQTMKPVQGSTGAEGIRPIRPVVGALSNPIQRGNGAGGVRSIRPVAAAPPNPSITFPAPKLLLVNYTIPKKATSTVISPQATATITAPKEIKQPASKSALSAPTKTPQPRQSAAQTCIVCRRNFKTQQSQKFHEVNLHRDELIRCGMAPESIQALLRQAQSKKDKDKERHDNNYMKDHGVKRGGSGVNGGSEGKRKSGEMGTTFLQDCDINPVPKKRRQRQTTAGTGTMSHDIGQPSGPELLLGGKVGTTSDIHVEDVHAQTGDTFIYHDLPTFEDPPSVVPFFDLPEELLQVTGTQNSGLFQQVEPEVVGVRVKQKRREGRGKRTMINPSQSQPQTVSEDLNLAYGYVSNPNVSQVRPGNVVSASGIATVRAVISEGIAVNHGSDQRDVGVHETCIIPPSDTIVTSEVSLGSVSAGRGQFEVSRPSPVAGIKVTDESGCSDSERGMVKAAVENTGTALVSTSFKDIVHPLNVTLPINHTACEQSEATMPISVIGADIGVEGVQRGIDETREVDAVEEMVLESVAAGKKGGDVEAMLDLDDVYVNIPTPQQSHLSSSGMSSSDSSSSTQQSTADSLGTPPGKVQGDVGAAESRVPNMDSTPALNGEVISDTPSSFRGIMSGTPIISRGIMTSWNLASFLPPRLQPLQVAMVTPHVSPALQKTVIHSIVPTTLSPVANILNRAIPH